MRRRISLSSNVCSSPTSLANVLAMPLEALRAASTLPPRRMLEMRPASAVCRALREGRVTARVVGFVPRVTPAFRASDGALTCPRPSHPLC